MKKYFASFVIVLIFILVGYHFLTAVKTVNTPYITIAGQTISLELALSPAEREQGLSGSLDLAENEGMLFVFEKLGMYPFWMKDMNFPIDIIWLDENMKVIYIKKDARPESYPETFTPNEEAKYVLEVVSGFSQIHGLKVGDNAEISQ